MRVRLRDAAVDRPGGGVDGDAAVTRPGRPAAPPGVAPGIARRRMPVLALLGALAVLVALLPPPHHHRADMYAAVACFVALTIAALVVPWHRLPRWCWAIVPIGYVGVIALLRDAQGAGSGLVPLYFLPIAWLTYNGRRSQVVAGLGAVLAALVVPILAVGPPGYPSSQWRLVLVTWAAAAAISVSVLAMVERDRTSMARISEQAALTEQSARLAMEARERLDSLLRAATATAIIGAEPDGTVTFFSAGAERLLGYAVDEVVGRVSLVHFLPPDDVADRAAELGVTPGIAAVTGIPRHSGSEESVWTYVRKDGARRRAAVTVTTRTDRSGGPPIGYVVVASDVTEHEQFQAERERLLAVQREVTEVLVEQNHRLRELTKMKDDLVATVSHELRTPLTSIRGFVELLVDDEASLDPERVRMLRAIDRNSVQLLRVAEDLLADPGGGHSLRVQFTDIDLSLLATEAIDSMASEAAARRIELSLVAGEQVLVHGDPARLHQLLGNLLSNAVKFTPAGGRVMVRAGATGQFARLEVLDDGPGIPEAERPQLFERFYRLASTADQGVPGSGLGLAIAKSVVEAHEGTVEIVDTPGWSTTFRVLLPLLERQPVTAEPPTAAPGIPA